ncbi:MAG: hypothetical protein PHH68_08545 [Candidatus Omnitrophica bacterium]|jgi:Flp pilus assembly pilin Flp|nr:hypothetical protein [Candidatus Omnitrophota bacterium]
MVRRRTKAQSLVEYSVLAACIAGALIGMQFYLKRAIQGRAKQSGDEIGEPYDSSAAKSKITTKINSRTTITSTPITDSTTGDVTSIKSDIEQFEDVSRTGTEEISAWDDNGFSEEVESAGGECSLDSIIGSSLYSSVSGTSIAGHTYSLAGGHTSEEVSDQFSSIYSYYYGVSGSISSDEATREIWSTANTLSSMINNGYITRSD